MLPVHGARGRARRPLKLLLRRSRRCRRCRRLLCGARLLQLLLHTPELQLATASAFFEPTPRLERRLTARGLLIELL
jgi:hypothetical protein